MHIKKFLFCIGIMLCFLPTVFSLSLGPISQTDFEKIDFSKETLNPTNTSVSIDLLKSRVVWNFSFLGIDFDSKKSVYETVERKTNYSMNLFSLIQEYSVNGWIKRKNIISNWIKTNVSREKDKLKRMQSELVEKSVPFTEKDLEIEIS